MDIKEAIRQEIEEIGLDADKVASIGASKACLTERALGRMTKSSFQSNLRKINILGNNSLTVV